MSWRALQTSMQLLHAQSAKRAAHTRTRRFVADSPRRSPLLSPRDYA
jgi:hypothetical protein